MLRLGFMRGYTLSWFPEKPPPPLPVPTRNAPDCFGSTGAQSISVSKIRMLKERLSKFVDIRPPPIAPALAELHSN